MVGGQRLMSKWCATRPTTGHARRAATVHANPRTSNAHAHARPILQQAVAAGTAERRHLPCVAAVSKCRMPCARFAQILLGIQQLLDTPNQDSPVQADAFHMFA